MPTRLTFQLYIYTNIYEYRHTLYILAGSWDVAMVEDI